MKSVLSVVALVALGACSDQIHLGNLLPAPDASDVLDATPAPLYWFADHETGDLSQWAEGASSDQIVSADAQLTVVTSPTHSGRFAVSSAIYAAARTSYARLFRAGSLPNDAYFRVWMYIQQNYTIGQYWNVFEFQGRTDPANPSSYVYLWSLDLKQASSGDMSWYLYDTPHARNVPTATIVVPIGRWFLVEAFMHQATDNTGQVTFWIDGNLLVDVTGVSTVPTMWLSWNVGGSASNITPEPAVIFLDDAAIAPTGP